VCAWLARREPPEQAVACCRVGGPNAGHTAYDSKGREWKLQQIPIGVLRPHARLYIGAGSVIDREILARELRELDDAELDASVRLRVDYEATLLEPEHVLAETENRAHGEAGLTARIGSTGKGVGAARAERVLRRASRARDLMLGIHPYVSLGCTADLLEFRLQSGSVVQIEGTQGYGLGLHAGFYPYATSADCRAIDILAQAGLSPWADCVDRLEIWLVLRTFPIRVAGNSGPLYRETTWQSLGVEPEYTTVTRKIRRVGEWDAQLARDAVWANGGPTSRLRVVLTFLDYVFPQLSGCSDASAIQTVAGPFLRERERELDCPITAVGTGPNTLVLLGTDR